MVHSLFWKNSTKNSGGNVLIFPTANLSTIFNSTHTLPSSYYNERRAFSQGQHNHILMLLKNCARPMIILSPHSALSPSLWLTPIKQTYFSIPYSYNQTAFSLDPPNSLRILCVKHLPRVFCTCNPYLLTSPFLNNYSIQA